MSSTKAERQVFLPIDTIQPIAPYNPGEDLIDYEEAKMNTTNNNPSLTKDVPSVNQAFQELSKFTIPKKTAEAINPAPPEHRALQDQRGQSAMILDEEPQAQSIAESPADPPTYPGGPDRNLTQEEYNLLEKYQVNYHIWYKARQEKDFKTFKKSTQHAKSMYCQLLKMIVETGIHRTGIGRRSRGECEGRTVGDEIIGIIQAAGMAVKNARGPSYP
ncbi:uncharacterized protein MELLADRAFT_107831 [Melampsora larici-populina 98AG31]|uniref:Uncharacterized protein n=1 Tax=Melampsora larici-populina (strain 98AG31 / pathotype 3-4-7) TaxID=747676 RepID=F4RR29_MELLP|nr:uncharacterized protein MELLADRAFT_107831 [Melampsora larici-populina 98AG31]EGG05140.1 hypothetical protein MELLADRAFT_107831 [Melampsora larici-populina 98AG31]